MSKCKKTIGIIGGMGPLATADLHRKITMLTQAEHDQEHLHVIIDSDCSVPDRSAAILHGGESPLNKLCQSAERLASAGAELLCLACNTAHYYLEDIKRNARLPEGTGFVSMPEETAAECKRRGLMRLGLLATEGTVRTGVYAAACEKLGIELLVPESAEQEAVMGLIYDGVKSADPDYDTAAFRAVTERLFERGAEALILGCTELPLAFEQYGIPGETVDPTEVLARALILAACGACRE